MTRNSPSDPINETSLSSFFSTKTMLLPGLAVRTCQPATGTPTYMALLDLTDLDQAMASESGRREVSALLSPEEQKLAATYAYSKRRTEWLGGRLACKTCVLGLPPCGQHPHPMPAVSVLPSPNGSPRLTGLDDRARPWPAISISHSSRYAVAMAAMAESCGVDIQQVSTRTRHVADRFSKPEELELLLDALPAWTEPQRLTLLWSVKEAYKKSLLRDQPVIFQGVDLLAVTGDRHVCLRLIAPAFRNTPAEIHALKLGEYILAYIVSNSCHA